MELNCCVHKIMLFIKVFYLLGIFVGANKLGHLAINSPLIVGGNIEFILVPVYQPSRIDVNALQWQVHFNAARSIREIETKRVTVYESGQAVFMELTNVNSSWRHAVVYVKDNGHLSNIVRLELLERSKGILHVMSYPSRIGDIAKIAFYPPEGFKEVMDAVQWWRSRYGGDAQIDSYEQRIVFTFFKNAHQAKYYLEYKDNSTIQKTNEIDLLTGGPQLEPTCTTVDCSDCICVHPDNYISCSTNDTMLSIWIGSDNVEINRTSTSEYTAYNFSIRRQHHMSIVRCFVVSSKYNAVFNASATLYVLGPPIAAHTPSRDETSIQTYSVIGTVSAVACFAGMALFILFKRRKETMVRTRNTRSRVEEIRISGIEQSEPMVDDHSCDHEYDEIEDNLQLSETSHQNTNPKTPYYLTPIPTTVELSPVATRLSRTMSTSENSSRMGATQITNSTGYDDLLISERDSPAKYTALKQSTAISHQKHYANE